MPMRWKEAVADYLNFIRHEKGLSKTTCEHYASWLHSYTDWLATNGYPDPSLEEGFTVGVLRRYQYAKARTRILLRPHHFVTYRPNTTLNTPAYIPVRQGCTRSKRIGNVVVPRGV